MCLFVVFVERYVDCSLCWEGEIYMIYTFLFVVGISFVSACGLFVENRFATSCGLFVENRFATSCGLFVENRSLTSTVLFVENYFATSYGFFITH